ncbi:hypothetical protein COHA_007296 [Chlorella ohadii]|uniref:Thiamine phosphate synthase/TenI domain-containing protein n=1 Tax=Chlorella ohadii TaxID=2649997 RepID=A0AAD5DML9_9CHLO|nr:hypothetical protein COHA_007296 [Chlorella ohadii]
MPFQLVVITPERTLPNEAATATALLSRGLERLHVRKPGATAAEVAAYLQALPPPARRCCMLHSCHEVAKQTAVRGIHYREADRPTAGVIKAPPGLEVSTSFHALPDLGVCRGELDYVFLSPIYSSISKPGHGGEGAAATFPDADALASALVGSRYPVLALGGVTPDRFSELAELGFAGAALLGSIWAADDPLAAWDAARRAAERLP